MWIEWFRFDTAHSERNFILNESECIFKKLYLLRTSALRWRAKFCFCYGQNGFIELFIERGSSTYSWACSLITESSHNKSQRGKEELIEIWCTVSGQAEEKYRKVWQWQRCFLETQAECEVSYDASGKFDNFVFFFCVFFYH